MKTLLLKLINFYRQHLSRLKGRPTCPFIPTCSKYAYDAIETHGVFYGLFLAGKRILRCHPFSKGGYDPVPPKKQRRN